MSNVLSRVTARDRYEDIIDKVQGRAICYERARPGGRALVRSLARRLAEDRPEASELRARVNSSIAGEPLRTGGMLAAPWRSLFVGVDPDLARPRLEKGEVDA